MNIKILQLHKRAVDTFDKIQDKVNINSEKCTIAIADGATQGYYSGIWANILTLRFIANPVFDIEGLKKFLKECTVYFKSQMISIPVRAGKTYQLLDEAKKAEGAYSTFIGLQITNDYSVDAVVCGDSNIFIRNRGQLSCFPSSSMEVLNDSGVFVNNNSIANEHFDYKILKITKFQIEEGIELFLVTDALARFIFNDLKCIEELDNLNDFNQFLSYAENMWGKGALEEDDLTLVKVTIDKLSTTNISRILPPPDFTFKKMDVISPPPPPPPPTATAPPAHLPPTSPIPQPPPISPEQRSNKFIVSVAFNVISVFAFAGLLWLGINHNNEDANKGEARDKIIHEIHRGDSLAEAYDRLKKESKVDTSAKSHSRNDSATANKPATPQNKSTTKHVKPYKKTIQKKKDNGSGLKSKDTTKTDANKISTKVTGAQGGSKNEKNSATSETLKTRNGNE